MKNIKELSEANSNTTNNQTELTSTIKSSKALKEASNVKIVNN